MFSVPLFSEGLVNKYDGRGGPHTIVRGYPRKGVTEMHISRATPETGYMPYPNDNPSPWAKIDYDIMGKKSNVNYGLRDRQKALGRTSTKEMEALARQGRIKALEEIQLAKEVKAKNWLVNNPNEANYKNAWRNPPVQEDEESIVGTPQENAFSETVDSSRRSSVIGSDGNLQDQAGDTRMRTPETAYVDSAADGLENLEFTDALGARQNERAAQNEDAFFSARSSVSGRSEDSFFSARNSVVPGLGSNRSSVSSTGLAPSSRGSIGSMGLGRLDIAPQRGFGLLQTAPAA